MQIIRNPVSKDDLIVSAFLLFLLLPLRLVFYQYLSHYWIGSLGVLSIVILTLVYLSRKGKLGFFGRALLRTIEKRTKGKTFKSMIITSSIVLYFGCLMIAGITHADNTIYTKTKSEFKSQGIHDAKSLVQYDQAHPNTNFGNFLIGILILSTPNEISFTMFKIMNDFFGGWFLPILTISVVETIEFLGVILYLRYEGRRAR